MKAKKNVLEKIKLSLLDFRSNGPQYFTIESSQQDIRILAGAENMFSGSLLTFVCSLARDYGFRFFVSTSCSSKPYIVIFFPCR